MGATVAWRGALVANGAGLRDQAYIQQLAEQQQEIALLTFISHDRRELIHFNVTASPTAAWIWQQLLEATPWGRQPAHFIHDRDAVCGRDFDRHAAQLGITGVRTPPRAPKANSIAERLVETIRGECLDHVIVVSEGHLRSVLAEFMHYYNHDRPHRTLSLQSPVPHANPGQGPVVSTPVLGGAPCRYACGLNSDGLLPPHTPKTTPESPAVPGDPF